ncbi:MAG: Hsp33 family molecular chaperone HslO [Clostridia bacterium]|nr:Hsp33 family molecular chaperone HslO [Clostridia bacterium]
MRIDKAISAIDHSASFRIYLAMTSGMVQTAHELHHTAPLATHLLGRALTGTGLMGIMLGEPDFKVTLQFKGDGPAQQVLCTAGSDGSTKGYIVDPLIDMPPKGNGAPNVGGAIGRGTLTCIRDTGLREPYVGTVNLVSGEIAEDITSYFAESEQRATSVDLGVKVGEDGNVIAAGGFILQMLPNPDEDAITAFEEILKKLPSIAEVVDRLQKEAEGRDLEDVMKEYLAEMFAGLPADFEVEPLDLYDIGWNCDCSMERLESVVLSLGSKQIREILDEDHEAELVCQFCGKKYHFDEDHLTRLLHESIRNRVRIQ